MTQPTDAADVPVVETTLTGSPLLENAHLNKGTAFTEEERRDLDLMGLLPPHVDTLASQTDRAYEAYRRKPNDLERHIFLRALQDQNTTLFYRLVMDHLAEMTPIIYTPVVGEACKQFSHIFRRPRGLFIAYSDREAIPAILANGPAEVDVIVVTDGERILGLGDQGADGMGIPIGKLSLYTVCGGIHPARTLPIVLDVGTNNYERLTDPLYLGWRHERVRGSGYDDFVEAFVQAVTNRYPRVLLQWEDFAQVNATRLLDRYRDRLCTFNDDIQGTAAVTVGTLLAATTVTGANLRDHRVVVVGAGGAGTGISTLLAQAMVHDGLSEAEARSRFYLLNSKGLVHDGLPDLPSHQRRFAQPLASLTTWPRSGATWNLLDVVRQAKPTILLGVSGQPGIFTEAVVRAMAQQSQRPIIFPLSNPTSCSEAKPADVLAWSDGRAVVATGSPFPDVTVGGRTVAISQCNNSYVFPAIGLGVLAVRARRVTDEMFMAAAKALAAASPAKTDPKMALLPPLEEIRRVARRIAVAVAEQALRQGVAAVPAGQDLERLIAGTMWTPRYPRLVRRK